MARSSSSDTRARAGGMNEPTTLLWLLKEKGGRGRQGARHRIARGGGGTRHRSLSTTTSTTTRQNNLARPGLSVRTARMSSFADGKAPPPEPAQAAQRDELHAALHERLVQTGEWHRILAALRASLDESGWTASLRDHAQSE